MALVRDLGVSYPLAQVLVRRGLSDVEAARSFLAADEEHPATAFGGLKEAGVAIAAAAGAGHRITVHGDYDVDGVTSTAILVRALRSIGADVDWFLPSRMEDGYGLSERTVRVLAERGTQLLILTDCGITAVEEVRLARELGIAVVVSDHHNLREDGSVPEALIVHPQVGDYPCTELCAGGVASKLAGAILESAGHDASITITDLDLVALATVADCVPLVGENRRLVRAGLRALARTEKPGLRALMRVAQVEPQTITEREISFRLAPRLNAAGRVARADAALELLLTHDPTRAEEIAQELDDINSRRRFEEQRTLQEADAQVAALGQQPAYVVWGDGWHPGVIGIVASRIAERTHRPTFVLSVKGGEATGSGRSIPGVNVLAGLSASAEALSRYGGHHAAAGCTLDANRLEEFRELFVAHFAATHTEADLTPRVRADAVAAGAEIGYELAEEFQRLAPFGTANPPVAIAIPAARLVDPRPMGEGGKHMRFSVETGGVRAAAVAFGRATLPDDAAVGRVQATFALELNEFRGAVSPRLVLRDLIEGADAAPALVGEPEPGTDAWEHAVLEAARAAAINEISVSTGVRVPVHGGLGAARFDAADDRRGTAVAAVIGSLVATGDPVLVVCADAVARQEQFRGRLAGFAVCAWDELAADPSLAADFDHVVALDPPLDGKQSAVLTELSEAATAHLAWGDPELRYSRDALDRDLSLRPGLVAAYRAFRDGSSVHAAFGRMPARTAGRMLGVLAELGLVIIASDGLSVPQPQGRTDLSESEVFRAAAREHEERVAWLSGLTQQAPVLAA